MKAQSHTQQQFNHQFHCYSSKPPFVSVSRLPFHTIVHTRSISSFQDFFKNNFPFSPSIYIKMANAIVLGLTLALSFQTIKDTVFPPAPADQVTNIRIGAGSSALADGAAPGVHLFDFEGKTIGFEKASGDKIEKGVGHDISVNHRFANDNAAAQAEYISVIQGGNDALCISYITATLPDGVQYNWNGDIGFQCDAPWTYGNTTLTSDATGGIYQPRCVWLDGDGSNGLTAKGMGLHFPSFLANQARVDQYGADNDVMCKADPRFKMYTTLGVEDAIPHFKTPPFNLQTLVDFDRTQTLNSANWETTAPDTSPLKGIGKRDSKNNGDSTAYTQSPKHATQIIKSNAQSHSASELCGSKTSWGPDFVSLYEGVFCDMGAKKTWPLCKGARDTACFDNAASRMRYSLSARDARVMGAPLNNKAYGVIHEW